MTRVSIERLLQELQGLPRQRGTLLIGMDGCGGSGKSTLAGRLGDLDPGVTVIHKDDFYLPSTQRAMVDPAAIGGSFDYGRLREHVLAPLHRGEAGRYQRYDWEGDRLAEWHEVPVGGIVIVEGVYAIREELADLYDLRVWVESPRSLRLSRGIDRDGEGARHLWEEEWMPAEDRYAQAQRPDLRADLVIDGTGAAADLSRGLVAVGRAPAGWFGPNV